MQTVFDGNGSAHDTHFAIVIFGIAPQQSRQQDSTRASHSSSLPQATHHDGRTIRSASRPKYDNALATRLGTRTLYSRDEG